MVQSAFPSVILYKHHVLESLLVTPEHGNALESKRKLFEPPDCSVKLNRGVIVRNDHRRMYDVYRMQRGVFDDTHGWIVVIVIYFTRRRGPWIPQSCYHRILGQCIVEQRPP